jgi:hypothetical protein
MLHTHGSEKFRREETLHVAGSEGVRGHSGNHSDPGERSEVRQQLHAREDHVTELPLNGAAPRGPASFWHRAFGLCIESSRALSGLPPCNPAAAADIRVHLPSPEKFALLDFLYRSPYPDEAGAPIVTIRRTADGGFCFQYSDGTCFFLNATGSEVFASWPDGLTLEDTTVYLYGPILGFILRLRGVVSLHGSGIELNGRGVALVGPPGAGKSTTAAAFVQAGFRALTDDVFALVDTDAGFFTQPAYPGIRLWPESVRNLWGSADALPRLTRSWEKRYLNLERQKHAGDFQPVPIAAIYLLGARSEDPLAPYFEGAPSLLDLLANTYAGYALSAAMRAHEFDVLSRCMSSVPVRKVIPHVDPARLPALRSLIEKDAGALHPA